MIYTLSFKLLTKMVSPWYFLCLYPYLEWRLSSVDAILLCRNVVKVVTLERFEISHVIVMWNEFVAHTAPASQPSTHNPRLKHIAMYTYWVLLVGAPHPDWVTGRGWNERCYIEWMNEWRVDLSSSFAPVVVVFVPADRRKVACPPCKTIGKVDGRGN